MLQLKAQYNSNKGSYAPLEKLQKITNRKQKTLDPINEDPLSLASCRTGQTKK